MLISENVSSIENIRDLNQIDYSQYQIKKKLLVRSASLANMSLEDSKYLNNCNISTVVDFRDYSEQKAKADKDIPGAENVFLPVLEDMQMSVLNENILSKSFPKTSSLVEVVMSQSERMKTFYKQFVTEKTAIEAYKDFFSLLLRNGERGKGTLYHCTAGKDRTGYATALILSALGFERSVIFRDYLESNKYMLHRIEKGAEKFAKLGIDKKTIKIAKRKFFANEEYLASAFELIDEDFGGINTYLNKVLGINDEMRKALQYYYLK
ncbi:tyrosine-protein phosphatase [Enterococcus sp. AZ163]|uniref:tyrosine-protein phosphatase n=1 Tax=Enterococcus sp. AZ163 TaxID=2774638 RepID=UPI003D2E13A0